MRALILAVVVSSCMIFKEKGLTWDEKKNGITGGIYYPYLRGTAAKEFERCDFIS
jgi:hypothetical protein